MSKIDYQNFFCFSHIINIATIDKKISIRRRSTSCDDHGWLYIGITSYQRRTKESDKRWKETSISNAWSFGFIGHMGYYETHPWAWYVLNYIYMSEHINKTVKFYKFSTKIIEMS